MTGPLNITVTAEPREKIHIMLVGVEYDILPPKASFGLKLVAVSGNDPTAYGSMMDEWIVKAFGKVGAKKIQARLVDEADDLDYPHIMKLMQAIAEAATGNPTSSS